MKAPVTQEEIDYRAELSNKINAISSMQGLFTDVEDKPRRLRILKALLATLNYGDEINAEIDAEIKAIEEAAAEAEEENDLEDSNAEAGTESTDEPAGDDMDIDLGSLDALESFTDHGGELLVEEKELDIDASVILTEDDLPAPAELDNEKDFSENN
jgi:hypothetical protein